MTPGARISAAIAVLDKILGGEPAEKALVNWTRSSRFAGSGDRSVIRDHVFDALRRMRSSAAMGGAMTGRGLMLGLLRGQGKDVHALFTGEGHAPAVIDEADEARTPTAEEALDCQDWLIPILQADLGARFPQIMALMQDRAPVFLRVNTLRGTVEQAIELLALDEITAVPHPLAPLALEVTEGARKVSASAAYLEGKVELQDVASQAVVEALPLRDGMKVLDYCAGGGGKSLAIAGKARVKLMAHDIDPRRMMDLPARAKRAGAKIHSVATADLTRDFDLVLADAPCSGSGAWRRSPEAKWRLEPSGLARLNALQDDVLDQAASLVTAGGRLAYATCTMIEAENSARVTDFLARNPRFSLESEMRLTPLDGGDGFYLAMLKG